jgi:hypothetical protein
MPLCAGWVAPHEMSISERVISCCGYMVAFIHRPQADHALMGMLSDLRIAGEPRYHVNSRFLE